MRWANYAVVAGITVWFLIADRLDRARRPERASFVRALLFVPIAAAWVVVILKPDGTGGLSAMPYAFVGVIIGLAIRKAIRDLRDERTAR